MAYIKPNTWGAEVPVTVVAEGLEKGELRYIGDGSMMGYTSRKKGERTAYEYRGRYGVGYVVPVPRWDTTTFMDLAYYIRTK